MAKEYKNPAATATLIVQKEDKLLLIQRKNEPYKDFWALPGGFLEYGKETLEGAGVRELGEETGLVAKVEDLILLRVASEPDRDPRGHVIDHIYIVSKYSGTVEAKDDAKDYKWFSFTDLPPIAFDHIKAIKLYMEKGYHYLQQ